MRGEGWTVRFAYEDGVEHATIIWDAEMRHIPEADRSQYAIYLAARRLPEWLKAMGDPLAIIVRDRYEAALAGRPS